MSGADPRLHSARPRRREGCAAAKPSPEMKAFSNVHNVHENNTVHCVITAPKDQKYIQRVQRSCYAVWFTVRASEPSVRDMVKAGVG